MPDLVAPARVREVLSQGGTVSESADPRIALACAAASGILRDWCEREFTVAETATSRLFTAGTIDVVEVDDFTDTDDLVVATGDPYNDTWTETTVYLLEPANGLRNGQPWAYNRIIGTWPTTPQSVKVTTKWGWVPAGIEEAALAQAVHFYKSPEAWAGWAADGQISRYLHPTAAMLAARYCKVGV